jgi:hypothetical protein
MRGVERILRVFVGVAGLALTIVAVGIIFSDGPTVTTGRVWLYGAPILTAGLLGLSLTCARFSRLLFFLINGFAVAVALLGVEFYLPTFQNPPPQSTTATLSMKTVAAELRHTGARAYPHVCPSMLIGTTIAAADGSPLFPLGGPSDNWLFALDGSDVVTRRSDQYGFNNPEAQWRADAVEVMAVGDSFTFGADVPFGRSFMDILRQEVGLAVNLGCGGNGPLSELATLIEYGTILRPKTVIWAYFEGNDLTKDIRREVGSPILRRYLDGKFTQQLATRQNEIDASLGLFVTNLLAKKEQPASTATSVTLRDVLLLTQLRTAIGLTCGFDRQRFQLACDISGEHLEQFSKILDMAAKIVGEWDGQFVFVYLPGEKRYSNWIANIDADGSRSAVLRIVDKLGIDLVDVHEVFLRRADPRALFKGHYNEEGYALVADAILMRLQGR